LKSLSSPSLVARRGFSDGAQFCRTAHVGRFLTHAPQMSGLCKHPPGTMCAIFFIASHDRCGAQTPGCTRLHLSRHGQEVRHQGQHRVRAGIRSASCFSQGDASLLHQGGRPRSFLTKSRWRMRCASKDPAATPGSLLCFAPVCTLCGYDGVLRPATHHRVTAQSALRSRQSRPRTTASARHGSYLLPAPPCGSRQSATRGRVAPASSPVPRR